MTKMYFGDDAGEGELYIPSSIQEKVVKYLVSKLGLSYFKTKSVENIISEFSGNEAPDIVMGALCAAANWGTGDDIEAIAEFMNSIAYGAIFVSEGLDDFTVTNGVNTVSLGEIETKQELMDKLEANKSIPFINLCHNEIKSNKTISRMDGSVSVSEREYIEQTLVGLLYKYCNSSQGWVYSIYTGH